MKFKTFASFLIVGLAVSLSEPAAAENTSNTILGISVAPPSGVQPAPSPTAVVVTSGVQPAPPPGLIVSPPAGVVPIHFPGVVVQPPPTEQPVFTAELYPTDADQDGATAPSGTTLTMNEIAGVVSSFLMTREIRPNCPPGTMCPMYIALQQTKFKVIKATESECGAHRYLAQASGLSLSGTDPSPGYGVCRQSNGTGTSDCRRLSQQRLQRRS